ncbi:hypothetical protein AB4391_01780 [Vibrio lentus]
MSWADCGFDSAGRPVGYVHAAVCDHEGCEKKIDRGLSYACGGMHGADEHGCEKYFCQDHLSETLSEYGRFYNVCDSCAKELVESGEWEMDHSEGCLVRVPVEWTEDELYE